MHPKMCPALFEGHAGHLGAERAKSILPAVLAGLLGGRTPGPAGAAEALRQVGTE